MLNVMGFLNYLQTLRKKVFLKDYNEDLITKELAKRQIIIQTGLELVWLKFPNLIKKGTEVRGSIGKKKVLTINGLDVKEKHIFKGDLTIYGKKERYTIIINPTKKD